MLSGSGVTVFRNSILFSAFMIYVDISKQLVPGGLVRLLEGMFKLHAFNVGAIL